MFSTRGGPGGGGGPRGDGGDGRGGQVRLSAGVPAHARLGARLFRFLLHLSDAATLHADPHVHPGANRLPLDART